VSNDGPRVERRGVKREHGEAQRVEAVAAPATVSGEQDPKCHWPARLGRQDCAETREPGDLPSQS